MMTKFLPDFLDEDSVETINALIRSLAFLKEEAAREGQDYIAYAIEDAIIQAKTVRSSKFAPGVAHNMP